MSDFQTWIESDAGIAAWQQAPVDALAAAFAAGAESNVERERDAARYRWLRSEDTATSPLYYPFWQEFNAKLCREKQMDALIDSAMTSRLVAPPKLENEERKRNGD